MLAQRFDGSDRVPVRRRALRGRDAARSCAALAAADPRVRVLDNPAQAHAAGAQPGAAGGARLGDRADGRAHALPARLPRARGRAAPRRRRRLGERAAGGRGRRAAGRGASRSRSRPGSARAGRRSDTPRTPSSRSTPGSPGLWWRDDARAARRLGRGVAQRPGLRARGADPQGGRDDRLRARRWPPPTSRATVSARSPRQYHRYGFYRVKTSLRHPESLRRSHVLAPGLVLTAVAARGVRRGRCGARPAPAWRPTRRRVAVVSVRAARAAPVGDAAALPRGVRHDARGVGRRLPARVRRARRPVARARSRSPAARRRVEPAVGRDDLVVAERRSRAAGRGSRSTTPRPALPAGRSASGRAAAARTSPAARGARSRARARADEPASVTAR